MQSSEEMDRVSSNTPDEPDGVFDVDSLDETQWDVMGKAFPRSEIKYFAQVFIIYIVIITCLVNLSLGTSDLNNLWVSLLSSCIGYMLPSPHIRKTSQTSTATPE